MTEGNIATWKVKEGMRRSCFNITHGIIDYTTDTPVLQATHT